MRTRWREINLPHADEQKKQSAPPWNVQDAERREMTGNKFSRCAHSSTHKLTGREKQGGGICGTSQPWQMAGWSGKTN